MVKRGHAPIRMCIGCRSRRKKEEMVRFIRGPEGAFLRNDRKRISGRGFYLCPDLNCLRKAQKKLGQLSDIHG